VFVSSYGDFNASSDADCSSYVDVGCHIASGRNSQDTANYYRAAHTDSQANGHTNKYADTHRWKMVAVQQFGNGLLV